MNLQADINWIKAELDHVREPHLIEAFKQLLTYRKANFDAASIFSTSKKELLQRAEASLTSIEEGNYRNIEEFKNEVENWKAS